MQQAGTSCLQCHSTECGHRGRSEGRLRLQLHVQLRPAGPITPAACGHSPCARFTATNRARNGTIAADQPPRHGARLTTECPCFPGTPMRVARIVARIVPARGISVRNVAGRPELPYKPSGFPIDRKFVAVSLNGEPFLQRDAPLPTSRSRPPDVLVSRRRHVTMQPLERPHQVTSGTKDRGAQVENHSWRRASLAEPRGGRVSAGFDQRRALAYQNGVLILDMAPMSSVSALLRPDRSGLGSVRVAGVELRADCAGALYWPEEGLLVVADLHLEKGSSFARRGNAAALRHHRDARAARAADRALRAALVIALGDSSHDRGGHARLWPRTTRRSRRCSAGATGSGSPATTIPIRREGIGGSFAATLSIGTLGFRHEPSRDAPEGEIAGHLHPVARIVQRGRAVSRRCFATDGQALMMPAFGAYAGGLNMRDRAFAAVFGARKFTAHMLGDNRLYAFAASRCCRGNGGRHGRSK